MVGIIAFAMTLIQIRNVPEDLHKRLKARAAERGQTLSELTLEAVVDYAARPTIAEFEERIRSHEAVVADGAEAVRAARAERG